MKAMLNHRSLMSGLDKGYIDEVAKDLNRYQTVERDREWLCVDDTPRRKKSFLVRHSKGLARWHVEMHKGEVIGVGVIHDVDLTQPYKTA